MIPELDLGFQSSEDLRRFFHSDRLPSISEGEGAITRGRFIKEADAMAQSIGRELKLDRLVFRETENHAPPGHVADTKARPDFVAALETDFEEGIPSWPNIRLVGENASAGSRREGQEKQMMTYVYYLLLARPELHVAQGILISKDSINFVVGSGGYGICSLKMPWGDQNLRAVLAAFIYRLYLPGNFLDQTCTISQEGSPLYTLKLTEQDGSEVNCQGYRHLFAASPFRSRTHVYSFLDIDPPKLRGREVRCIKEYWDRVGSRFDEYGILSNHVHKDGIVPGVVQLVGRQDLQIPSEFAGRNKDHKTPRVKRRHGMREFGQPFMSIPTLGMVLKIVYDTLEVLRFLRVHRNVLHRDVSKGNVMYTNLPRLYDDGNVSKDAEKAMCFIGHLLDSGKPMLATSLLLIDFNHAEHLEAPTESGKQQLPRIGTPVFIARAVERGKPVELPGAPLHLVYPKAPDSYEKRHADRAARFPALAELPVPDSKHAELRSWRHALDHDVESVFWLMLYYTLLARPEGKADEELDHATWSKLFGSCAARNWLLAVIADNPSNATVHSAFTPVQGLLHSLAKFLRVDREYFPPGPEAHNDPECLAEIFQRSILDFIEKNAGEDFLKLKVVIDMPRDRAPSPES